MRLLQMNPKNEASMGVWGCQTFASKGVKSALNGRESRGNCALVTRNWQATGTLLAVSGKELGYAMSRR